MTNTLTLEIADDIYELLLERAQESGETPERVALAWIENAAKHSAEDPLLQLAGVFESDITNISERHDEYIGQALRHDNE